jgi:hypothetical protein
MKVFSVCKIIRRISGFLQLDSIILFCVCCILFAQCKKDDDCDVCPTLASKSQAVVTYTDIWIQDSLGFYSDLGTMTILTPNIVHSGTVQVFLRNDSHDEEWFNLPWSIANSIGFTVYNFSYSLDGVRIHVYNQDGSPMSDPGLKSFKVIVTSL